MKRISLISRLLLMGLLGGSPISTAWAETILATTTITISGTAYMTPVCTINNNNPVVVDFGTMKITELDTIIGKSSTIHQVNKSVPVSCGDSATPPLSGYSLKMTITPKESAFDSALLGTSNPNLGIYVQAGSAGNEMPLVPGKATTMDTEGGVPGNGTGSFIFTPVANSNAMPAAGVFTGNATMTIDYE